MGRNDKQREAISGTSKGRGMKALWHPELLSNTDSLIQPTLDLITTRRKERRLTGRWRDGARVCVRVKKKKKHTSIEDRKKIHTEIDKHQKHRETTGNNTVQREG